MALCLLTLLSAASSAASFGEGREAYQSGDYQTALTIWQPLADEGDLNALMGLAQLYLDGRGVPKDPDRALDLYQQGAEQGSTFAMRKLGVHYLLGEIVEPDPDLAFAWRLRAAEAGDAKAQYEAAVQLQHGIGVERYPEQAMSWLRKAADGGVADARWDLATILSDKDSAHYDLDGATTLYRALGLQGDLDAMVVMFWLHEKSDVLPRNLVEARHWAHRIAAQDPVFGEALLALNTLAKEHDTASLKAMVAAVIRLAQDSASRPDRAELSVEALDRLCGLTALPARNAEEVAAKEEVLRDINAFFDDLRAQGEAPCT